MPYNKYLGKLTVVERLAKIREYNLPHKVVAGNALVNDLSIVLDLLDDRIPVIMLEHKLNMTNVGGFGQGFTYAGGNIEDAANALAKMYGNNVSGDLFLDKTSGDSMPYFSFRNVQINAFYDPVSEFTHYFLLPAKEIKE